MPRCAAVVLAVAVLACAALPAVAQQRNFPANALRGELLIQQPPDVTLNGQPARLAPGARIRGDNNLLVLSGALAGQKLTVHYTVDSYGLLLNVWLLGAEERARQPWPRNAAEAASWRFDPVAQTWSKP
ncbi:MAG: hypothetical protein IV093_22160 [Rubrivivax sp.]|nr:hypothetical protein [Rubrivivax sp.]